MQSLIWVVPHYERMIDTQKLLWVIMIIPPTSRASLASKNDNPFFEGSSPLQVVSQGDMISLYETYRRIEQLTRESP